MSCVFLSVVVMVSSEIAAVAASLESKSVAEDSCFAGDIVL